TARVDFYRFIRPERKFASPEELMEEIDRNVQEVAAYFKDLHE
ncbi:MAG: bifunctional riboflavin kinase/FAD synthetase, partial [Parasporobacterium sp.]|nr:bifunctional riboflavin kinase/FAD synthetase [Parasporobacterium sp.]